MRSCVSYLHRKKNRFRGEGVFLKKGQFVFPNSGNSFFGLYIDTE